MTFILRLPPLRLGQRGGCSTRHLYLDQWNRLLTDGLLGLSLLLTLQFWSFWTAVTKDLFPFNMIKDQYKVHHNLLSLLASIYLCIFAFKCPPIPYELDRVIPWCEESCCLIVKPGKNLSEYWQEKKKTTARTKKTVTWWDLTSSEAAWGREIVASSVTPGIPGMGQRWAVTSLRLFLDQ